MALQYGLNNAVDFSSDRLMMFASIYNRTLGQPMDKTQLWYPLDGKTALERAKTYAASASAFVGQEIAVVDVEYEEDGTTVKGTKVKIYVIQDAAGTLEELGQMSGINAIDRRVSAIEEFFKTAEGETLNKALDTLIEIQQYIDEHGNVFLELRSDVDHIYDPWQHEEDGSYKRDENGNRILAEKPEGVLQEEIDRAIAAENVIYNAEGGTNEDGTKYATGKLPDEIKDRKQAIIDEAAARERADNVVYDADGGRDEDGNVYATGKLPEEIERAQKKEQFILDLLFGEGNVAEDGYVSDIAEKVGTGEALVYGILGDFRNYNEETGLYQYNTLTDFIKNATSIATADKFGGVLSSNPTVEDDQHKDLVEVVQADDEEAGINAGQMRVIDLNVNKLYQTAYLVLDGGNAVDNPFGESSQKPGLDNEPT